jgi:hypothetical protein
MVERCIQPIVAKRLKLFQLTLRVCVVAWQAHGFGAWDPARQDNWDNMTFIYSLTTASFRLYSRPKFFRSFLICLAMDISHGKLNSTKSKGSGRFHYTRFLRFFEQMFYWDLEIYPKGVPTKLDKNKHYRSTNRTVKVHKLHCSKLGHFSPT